MSGCNDKIAWLIDPSATCEKTTPPPQRAYRMVLLGAPGVGKGTQAEYLCEKLQTCQLSTGDVFRAARQMKGGKLSPAMQSAMIHMDKGELVPDETVIEMVRERIKCLECKYGFLLDGFPRTVEQAEALDEMLNGKNLKLDAVLSYELPMEEVIARLSGRRTCPGCKATFHLKAKPPKVEGTCDKCGDSLYQRDDDKPESIQVRLKAYHESTAPLTDYYGEKGLLLTVSAEGSPSEVFERTVTVLP